MITVRTFNLIFLWFKTSIDYYVVIKFITVSSFASIVRILVLLNLKQGTNTRPTVEHVRLMYLPVQTSNFMSHVHFTRRVLLILLHLDWEHELFPTVKQILRPCYFTLMLFLLQARPQDIAWKTRGQCRLRYGFLYLSW